MEQWTLPSLMKNLQVRATFYAGLIGKCNAAEIMMRLTFSMSGIRLFHPTSPRGETAEILCSHEGVRTIECCVFSPLHGARASSFRMIIPGNVLDGRSSIASHGDREPWRVSAKERRALRSGVGAGVRHGAIAAADERPLGRHDDQRRAPNGSCSQFPPFRDTTRTRLVTWNSRRACDDSRSCLSPAAPGQKSLRRAAH
ncbi:hypothetical protein GEV33_014335 [Tenebrio molitor]|uniref:Uncharacterized protein n=1 Tax=Tenebrio molitor TaxID=7067 RepID=A0A8J6H5H1_TENMO|nr:hypothetical protein GEV33_014335 [Tenebrio molitor]